MIPFKKPSGVVVEVNENSVDAAIALGWERVKPKAKAKAKAKPKAK